MTNHSVTLPCDDEHAQISELVAQAKRLAVRYRQLTGKPLGITGEIAECEAAAILGICMQLAQPAMTPLR